MHRVLVERSKQMTKIMLSCNELFLVLLLEENFQDKNLFNFSIGANDHKVELEARHIIFIWGVWLQIFYPEVHLRLVR